MNCLADHLGWHPARGRFHRVARFAALLTTLAASVAHAAPPRITTLSVRGLQAGGTTRLSVRGSGLLTEPRLLLDVPLASQVVVGAPRADAADFDVALDASVEPGVYSLRLSTADGITTPEIITIDRLPQRPAGVANQVEPLPVAVHGVVAGAVVQESRFTGHKGDRLVLDVLARRFGSKLRPVLHLYDSQRRPIAWSLPLTELAGDTRLAVELPADDTYVVAVHDLAYAGQAPAYYRLAIGQFDYVDQVFPPVVSRQQSARLELIGKFGMQPIARLESASIAATGTAITGDWQPLAWAAGSAPVGLRPRLRWSDFAELVEGQSLNPERQLPALPVAVSGRLAEPGEQDIYFLDVAEGDKLHAEVFADRLGSPLDATLELHDAKGARLAVNDDGPAPALGPDPRLDYVVPKGLARLGIVVTDAHRRGGANSIYRLVVSRSDAAPPADFALSVFEDTHHLAAEGSKVFRVAAERVNYDGPIQLAVEGLPAGFSAVPIDIPTGAAGALVELRRVPAADPASLAAGRIVVRGRSVAAALPAGRAEIAHTAELANHPLAALQPWMKYDLAVAPTNSPVAFGVAWDDASAEPPLYLGIDSKLPIRFHRGPGANGPVRLSLITSQVPVLVNGQPNAAQLIRGTAATIDIPLDAGVRAAVDRVTQAEKALADLEKKRPKEGEADPQLTTQIIAAAAQRDEAAQQLREAEAKLKLTSDYLVLVPADIKAGSYDLAIRAELRGLDNQTIVCEAYTPPRRCDIRVPLELAVAESSEAGVTLDPKTGASVTLHGTIKRLGGFAGDVTLTLAGLPAGVAAPRVVLKPADAKFELAFKLPANSAGDKIETVQIVATLAPEARRANVLARLEQPVPAIRLERPAASVPPAAATNQPPATK